MANLFQALFPSQPQVDPAFLQALENAKASGQIPKVLPFKQPNTWQRMRGNNADAANAEWAAQLAQMIESNKLAQETNEKDATQRYVNALNLGQQAFANQRTLEAERAERNDASDQTAFNNRMSELDVRDAMAWLHSGKTPQMASENAQIELNKNRREDALGARTHENAMAQSLALAEEFNRRNDAVRKMHQLNPDLGLRLAVAQAIAPADVKLSGGILNRATGEYIQDEQQVTFPGQLIPTGVNDSEGKPIMKMTEPTRGTKPMSFHPGLNMPNFGPLPQNNPDKPIGLSRDPEASAPVGVLPTFDAVPQMPINLVPRQQYFEELLQFLAPKPMQPLAGAQLMQRPTLRSGSAIR